MSKKLWTGSVMVDFEMAIYAETEEEALKIAKRSAWEELRNLDTGDASITVSHYAPPGYLDDALPWGEFGDDRERTVGEIKAELGVESPTDTLLKRAREAAAKQGGAT